MFLVNEKKIEKRTRKYLTCYFKVFEIISNEKINEILLQQYNDILVPGAETFLELKFLFHESILRLSKLRPQDFQCNVKNVFIS